MPTIDDDPSANMIPNLLFSGSAESSFACEQCKRKKVRCDKTAPHCSSCRKSGRACNYPLAVPKPGPKPSADNNRNKRRRHSSSADDASPSTAHTPRHYPAGASPPSPSRGPELDSSIYALVHPTHDAVAPPRESPANPADHGPGSHPLPSQNHYAKHDALAALGFTEHDYQAMLDVYFAHMTAFCLFHRPSFGVKLHAARSAVEAQALIVAMATFAARFAQLPRSSTLASMSPETLSSFSRRLVRDALDECGEEPPTISTLQALVLVAWTTSYQGVRGRAWKLVGECVRIAYELNLHKEPLDSEYHWVEQEERRRLWWAVWELDVFTSTIKRRPTAIDWFTNTTHLPATEEAWFTDSRVQSCPLSTDPRQRWKDLESCGVESGWSWFICFNMYKWESYQLSMWPMDAMKADKVQSRGGADTADYISRKRDLLANSLQCARLALPPALNSHNRVLSFRPASRIQDAYSYSITLMISVVRFLLCRIDILPTSLPSGERLRQAPQAQRTRAWDNMTACTDEVASIIRNCALEHVELVNACLSNAIWWHCCTITLTRVFNAGSVDIQHLHSNDDLLRTTLRQYTRFWGIPSTLLESLDTMEDRLLKCRTTATTAYDGRETNQNHQHIPRGQAATEERSAAATASLPTPLSSVSPFVSSTEAPHPGEDPAMQYDPLHAISIDSLFDIDSWDFDSLIFRCPFE